MSRDPITVEHSADAAPRAAGRLVVTLFAGMAEIVGSRRLEVVWSGGTVADLRRAVGMAWPAIGPLLERSAVVVAGRYAVDDTGIVVGADVAIIPPVSGG
jgi:molybdopterin converting factor small subunit